MYEPRFRVGSSRPAVLTEAAGLSFCKEDSCKNHPACAYIVSMRTIAKYSRYFGRHVSRQQETILVLFVPLVAVVFYALWGASILH